MINKENNQIKPTLNKDNIIAGKVWRFGDNIDTDQIIPSQYLIYDSISRMTKHAFEPLDPDFSTRVKPGDIIVGGKNFGCGSSREQAPAVIKQLGINLIIAGSFARIFFRNGINTGMFLIECEKAYKISRDDKLVISMANGIIVNRTRDEEYNIMPIPEFFKEIINSGGLLEFMKKAQKIDHSFKIDSDNNASTKVRSYSKKSKKALSDVKKIAVLPGDGIGPEIMEQAVKIIKTISETTNMRFELVTGDVGGVAIDKYGNPLPENTIKICKDSDAILFGAVGGPKWDFLKGADRPERGILQLRKEFALFANIRPVQFYPSLEKVTPVKIREDVSREGKPNFVLIRELTGGLYFGKHETITGRAKDIHAIDVMEYSESEIDRIARVAFMLAMERDKRVTSVDKANVLDCSRLWRDVVNRVSGEYPEIQVEHMYIDNCAMKIISSPQDFDVILTENLFGDILSDEGALIAGSLGLLPSASIGEKVALYEPIHGSAPDIAGLGTANPVGMILSVAMMLRYSFGMNKEASIIDQAVVKTLEEGFRTQDLYTADSSDKKVSTHEFADKVIGFINQS